MADEMKTVQVYETDGRLSKAAPQPIQVDAVEMDGKLYRSEDDAHRAKALAALNELLRSDRAQRFASPSRLLENARAVATILTAYADATE